MSGDSDSSISSGSTAVASHANAPTTYFSPAQFQHGGRKYRMFKRAPDELASWYFCIECQRRRHIVSARTPLESEAVEFFKRYIDALRGSPVGTMRGLQLAMQACVRAGIPLKEVTASYLAANQLHHDKLKQMKG